MPAADHGPTAPFLARIGAELRARRRAAGLTAQELAERAAVSRRMLSQVEQGQANPSLVTVDKLARALGTDFATLAGAGGRRARRRGRRPTEVWRSAAGGSATLHVTGARVGGPELWEWTLAPGDPYRGRARSAGLGGAAARARRNPHARVEGEPCRPGRRRVGPARERSRLRLREPRREPARFTRVVQIAGARRPDRLRA